MIKICFHCFIPTRGVGIAHGECEQLGQTKGHQIILPSLSHFALAPVQLDQHGHCGPAANLPNRSPLSRLSLSEWRLGITQPSIYNYALTEVETVYARRLADGQSPNYISIALYCESLPNNDSNSLLQMYPKVAGRDPL